MAFKDLETKRSLRKKYRDSEVQLKYAQKSLKTMNDELATVNSDLKFFKVRIIKLLNEVNKLCDGNNLILPSEIERILIELAVTDEIDIKETAQGFICVGVEKRATAKNT